MKQKKEAVKKTSRARAKIAGPVADEESAAPLAPFFVVGLGASAGGLEALRSFFDALPPDSGMAFVVIQHLSPDHKSRMAELLARNTRMPVEEARDGTSVEPDRVYVIPAGKCLTIFHGKLLLTPVGADKGRNLPIDLFFTSLAQDRGERAIGIGLSGTGSDGTRGIRAIKEAGGLVMVQEESSAKFSGMPHSAIATGLADFILPASEMPRTLLKFIRHPLFVRPAGAALHPPESTMQKILALLRTKTRIDFSAYKQSTVARRLVRRMGISQIKNSDDYLEYLQQSAEEVEAFAKDLLICVTRFFRDREAFEGLRTKVIPALFESAAEEKSIRVWVPGCATGEEAYSIAMLMQMHAATLGEAFDVKIFATDVSREALELASRGVYPASITADVPAELVARYFRKDGDGFRICRSLRDQIVFARHDLLKDPPFTRMNLVSCRNLLIYLQPEWQRKVLAFLHFALRPGGYLLLGTSETVGEQQNAFEMTESKARIFQRRSDAPPLEKVMLAAAPARVAPPVPQFGEPAAARRSPDKLWDAVSARLIADFAPTGFVLGDDDQILYSFGEPQKFVTLRAGRAHLDLLALVPRDLSLALSTALRRVRKQNVPVRYREVKFRRGRTASLMDLTVEPIAAGRGGARAVLVLLKESKKTAGQSAAEKFDPDQTAAQRIADLEEDLRASRENLQASAEHQQTTGEELQATNEELIAANEELQSTNEELESVNEELTTMNSEFQEKIDELLVANNDLGNFLRTSQIGTIFLDRALHIRRFTPVVAEEMHLKPQDTGRCLTELSHPLIAELTRGATSVLRDGTPLDKTVETKPGVWYLLRISPYRREGASDEGVVATFVNVSAVKASEREAAQAGKQKQKARPPAKEA